MYFTRSASGSSGWTRSISADEGSPGGSLAQLGAANTSRKHFLGVYHLAERLHPHSPSRSVATGCTGRRKIAPMPAGTLRTRPRLIESRQNPRVKELRAALARTGRTPSGLIAIEGE